MGFRSDVTLYLDKEAWKAIQEKAKEDKNLNELLENAAQHDYRNSHELFWNDIKWYEDDPQYYPDIYAITEFLKETPEKSWYMSGIDEDGETWRKGLLCDVPEAGLNNPIRIAVSDALQNYDKKQVATWLEKELQTLAPKKSPATKVQKM